MYKKTIIFFVTLFLTQCIYSQTVVSTKIEKNDTIAHIELPEVPVKAKGRAARKIAKQQKRYDKTVYNVKKALPFAKLAAQKIYEIEIKIAKINSEKEKKEMLKTEYKELMKQFKEPLTKLTITQGKILVRLVYRETDNTSFHHIKEYRGSVNAYFWQSLALLFGNNLKADYDPEGEDKEIEEIVQLIEKGEL